MLIANTSDCVEPEIISRSTESTPAVMRLADRFTIFASVIDPSAICAVPMAPASISAVVIAPSAILAVVTARFSICADPIAASAIFARDTARFAIFAVSMAASAIFAAVAAGEYPTVAAAADAMGDKRVAAYRPDPVRAAGYDILYDRYSVLHDYFGRGTNEVMHELKALQRRVLREGRV